MPLRSLFIALLFVLVPAIVEKLAAAPAWQANYQGLVFFDK